MNCKRMITAFISAIWLSVSLTVYVSNAAVIEPEIVKTETWTTSYYIDDDKSTLYPYIDCQADIYSDGTVKCYFWNSHEWDGFATVSHAVTIINSSSYSNESKEYMFKNKLSYSDDNNNYYPVSDKDSKITDYSAWDNIDLSYYPNEYDFKDSSSGYSNFSRSWSVSYNNNPTFYYYYCKSKTGSWGGTVNELLSQYSYYGALPNLPVNKKIEVIFTPKIDITEEYSFRFLGHDFIVTPEILSSHVIATPQLSEQEKYIAELEKKNAELTAEIERLKQDPSSIQDDIMRLDANGDGSVNAVDASIVLSIYAYNSTNKTPLTKLSDYFKIVNNK
ncbi:MAG: hypothetical protein K6G33_01585 [Ruminococcus sp.]|uniref:hypothetical protein n=1 Tax=Ruminococcus sp. TaxID=41978 RepID=UPI0025FC9115|nr:hypothetical protein [Ruminococcus sp.]MCR5599425.1 hypothetical protein [Ruminococcus sp.]